MASGTGKFFNSSKGFGFIARDDGGGDVLIHATALERAGIRELNEGDLVSFGVEEDRRSGKVSATNLRVTGAGPGSVSSNRPDQSSQSNFHPHGAPPRPASGARGAGARQVEGSGSGTVTWFNATKGFGFIQPGGGAARMCLFTSRPWSARGSGTCVKARLCLSTSRGTAAAARRQQRTSAWGADAA